VKEFANDDKTKGADWESAIRACIHYKSKQILVNDDNAP